MKEYRIGKNEAGQRFDKYLFKLLCNAKQSLIYKQLRNKNITLNNHKAKGNELLNIDDIVRIYMSDDTIDIFSAKKEIKRTTNDNLNVIYEDENILLADKPYGILSQKATGTDISMNELLIFHMLDAGMPKEVLNTFKPAFCNRLDRNTTGLMIAGKTLSGLKTMSELLKNRTLSKYYLAIVNGIISENRHIDGYLIKDEKSNRVRILDNKTDDSDYIETFYTPLAVKNGLTLIKVKLITGKTHQIRAHLASIGHSILGDPKYGDIGLNKKMHTKRQLLHSYEVIFPEMPDKYRAISGKSFTTPFPSDFLKYFTAKDMEADNG